MPLYKGRLVIKACIHCGGPASKVVHFQEDGGVVIERYCDECMQPENFARLQKWYDRDISLPLPEVPAAL